MSLHGLIASCLTGINGQLPRKALQELLDAPFIIPANVSPFSHDSKPRVNKT